MSKLATDCLIAYCGLYQIFCKIDNHLLVKGKFPKSELLLINLLVYLKMTIGGALCDFENINQ